MSGKLLITAIVHKIESRVYVLFLGSAFCILFVDREGLCFILFHEIVERDIGKK